MLRKTRSQTARDNLLLLENPDFNFEDIIEEEFEEEFLENEDVVDTAGSEEASSALFHIKLKLATKSFFNERNYTEVGNEISIHCSNLEGFQSMLWSSVKNHVKKEAIEEEGKFAWVENEPEKEDISRFVVFAHRRHKKCIRWDLLNNNKLHFWSGENSTVQCFILVFMKNTFKSFSIINYLLFLINFRFMELVFRQNNSL